MARICDSSGGKPPHSKRAKLQRTVSRLLRGFLLALVVLGVAAGLGRAWFLRDFAQRAEPSRVSAMHALGIVDPIESTRFQGAVDIDSGYAAHPMSTLMHVLPGAAYLAFGALQFSSSFRRRHLRWHRVAGRCLIIAAVAGSLSALVLGLVAPFAGNRERLVITLFGVWWLVATLAGYAAIRRGDRRAHRQWMIRGYSVALAISLIRVVLMVFSLFLMPYGYTTRAIFMLALWSGWIVSVIAAEAWIASTLDAAHHDARDVVAL